jgi:hypothetical protein
VNAAAQRVIDFFTGLADAGEDNLGGVTAGTQHAEEFAARDDVEAGSGFGQQGEDGERGVGLHRVADVVREIGESRAVGAVAGENVGGGVDVGRGANGAGEVGERDLFAIVVVA